MLQTIQTFRDFIEDDHEKQFAFMPLQLETCMLLKSFEEDENGVYGDVLYVFDSGTHLIGVIKNPHYIPQRA